jgi:hypothetical protein
MNVNRLHKAGKGHQQNAKRQERPEERTPLTIVEGESQKITPRAG